MFGLRMIKGGNCPGWEYFGVRVVLVDIVRCSVGVVWVGVDRFSTRILKKIVFAITVKDIFGDVSIYGDCNS